MNPHLAHGVQLGDGLVDVLATVDNKAEEFFDLGLHGHHAKPHAHHVQGRRPLAQAEGRVCVPQGGDQLHVPLVGQPQVLFAHVEHLLGLDVDVVRRDVAHPSQTRPVGYVHVLRRG